MITVKYIPEYDRGEYLIDGYVAAELHFKSDTFIVNEIQKGEFDEHDKDSMYEEIIKEKERYTPEDWHASDEQNDPILFI